MKNIFQKLFLLLISFSIVGVQTAMAQPGPPVDGPPCWPPPCIPVDGGIVFAIAAAVLFGALMIYRSYKLRLNNK
jgi:hypothetical protein